MTQAHLLDKLIDDEVPLFRNAADVEAFEATPYAQRIAAHSTYEALQRGAAQDPSAPAIQFLPNANAEQEPVVLSHGQFIAGVTQAANMFADLGIGPGDVVSFLLPLLPQSFIGLFGAQAAGIANPVNPLLSPTQIGEILRAANTKVLVALGPMPGSDIWDKVQQVKGQLPKLKAIVVVHGAADDANAVFNFDEKINQYPSDKLSSGRHIASSDVAGYFHTGGTTGTPKLVRHSHGNQVYQAWAVRVMLPVRVGGAVLFGLPLFHVGGALTQGLTTLAGGGSLVVLSPAGWRDPGAIRNVWQRAHVAVSRIDGTSGRRRYQQYSVHLGWRLGNSGSGVQGLCRKAHSTGARGLRYDRDLQRACHELPRPAVATGLSGPCLALQPCARRQG
jgi:fatty-acyl-CoA synthase